MLPLANFFPVQYQKFDKILQDRPIVQIYVIDTQWFSSWNVARSFSWQACLLTYNINLCFILLDNWY